GYGNLAYMRSADSLDNTKDSVNKLQKMVSDKNTDTVFRELAEIKQAMLLADTIELAQLKKRLKPYIESNSPWRSSAMELVAGAMLRDGDADGAKKMFKQISEDALVTSGVRSRATEMLVVLGKK
ncbi:MAG: hypothetical protein KAJ75_00175, partial [Alphaproteobacteria bacterium]|nr:hypothetical protein [Alphaproteobacteria bacterium]